MGTLSFSSLALIASSTDLPLDTTILWSPLTKRAYVSNLGSQSAGVWSGGGIETIDCSGGTPVSLGRVELEAITFSLDSTGQAPIGLHPQPIVAESPNQSCVDASDLIWTSYGGEDVFFVAYDPTSGDAVFQGDTGTDVSADQVYSTIRSFMAGGVNYIWAYVRTVVEGVHHDNIAVWPAASGPNTPVDLTDFGPSTFLDTDSAGIDFFTPPIFDQLQYAYIVSNGTAVTEDDVFTEDGSFTITQFDVSAGVPSQTQDWSFGNDTEGRAYGGLFNPIDGTIVLFTTQGAVQIFSAADGTLATVAPPGTLAPLFPPGSDSSGTLPYYVPPDVVLMAQDGRVDSLNCFVTGLGPDIVQSSDPVYGQSFFSGFVRLNLADYSFLDEHYPQNEWLSADTNPSDMTDNPTQMLVNNSGNTNAGSFVFAPENTALMWVDQSTFYQLNWPSTGLCPGALAKKNRPNLWVT